MRPGLLLRAFHSLRNRRLWIVLGLLCAAAAARAYSGSGIGILFGGSATRLLFASLGGLGICVAGYWLSRSTYNALKTSRTWLWLVLASILLSAGGVLHGPAIVRDNVGAIASIASLVLAVIGFRRILQLRHRRTGHWSSTNQPGR